MAAAGPVARLVAALLHHRRPLPADRPDRFVRLYEAGYLRRAQDPILWCPEDRTSLAQADVEDLERTSRLHTIRFGENGC